MKLKYLLVIVGLCVPSFGMAQLSSTNFIVTGQSISGSAQTTNASSTNFQSDQESGGIYVYDASTSTNNGGGSSSGGGGGVTTTTTPTSSSTPPVVPPPTTSSSSPPTTAPPTQPGTNNFPPATINVQGGGGSDSSTSTVREYESNSTSSSQTDTALDQATTAVAFDTNTNSSPSAGPIRRILQQANQLLEPLNDYVQPLITVIESDMGRSSALGSGAVLVLFGFSRVPFSLANLFRSLYHLWSNIFGFVAFWKKRRAWGTVYDSETKVPLDPAYVELFDGKGNKAAEAITDLDGRYGFVVPPGIYTMRVRKTNYSFPSQKHTLKDPDVLYSNLYLGGEILVNDSVTKDVPMDPVNFDWNQYEKIRTNQLSFIHHFDPILVRVLDIIFYTGALFSVWQVVEQPNVINFALLGVYGLLIMLRVTVGGPVLYGHVTKDNRPLPFAVVTASQGGHTVRKAVSDQYGRYVLLVQPNSYGVSVQTHQPDDSYQEQFNTNVKARRGVINDDLSF